MAYRIRLARKEMREHDIFYNRRTVYFKTIPDRGPYDYRSIFGLY